MTDATTSVPSPAGEPRAPGSALRLLEMFMFAVVFIAGGLLSWLAAFGESEAQSFPGSPRPIVAPVTTESPPDLGVPEFEPETPGEIPGLGQVMTIGARSEADPPVGCTGHVRFIWDIDPSTLSEGTKAEIRVTGGDVAGDYRREVRSGQVRLELDVQLSGPEEFTADLVSISGQPVIPTPLTVTYDQPGC